CTVGQPILPALYLGRAATDQIMPDGHGVAATGEPQFDGVAVAFYLVLFWAKQTRALHLALLIVGFHAAALWAGHFDLTITSWMFEGACLAVIGLLVLLFQAELQHSLLRLDSIAHLRFHAPAASIRTYDAIVGAMFEMAQSKIGALIVRQHPISTFSCRAGESDLGCFVSWRRDNGQDRHRPGGVCECACGPIHLRSMMFHLPTCAGSPPAGSRQGLSVS